MRLYHTAHATGEGPGPGYADTVDGVNFTPATQLIFPVGACLTVEGGECLLDPAYLRLDDGTMLLYFTWLDLDQAGSGALGIGRAIATDG